MPNSYEREFADAFRAIADFVTLSTSQLSELADAQPGHIWRTNVLLSGLGRCHDYRCLDTVKHFAKYPEVSSALYK